MTGSDADLLMNVERIALDVAGKAAADVDRCARFPDETISALRQVGALAAAVPHAFGGPGLGVVSLVQMCTSLARHCASSAMVLAMHHIQVSSIAGHCKNVPKLREYLRRVVDEQPLIASVTSELGPSGDMRRSVAAVEGADGKFRLTKQATTISYGKYADDLLITARRSPESAPSDQVLVVVPKGSYELAIVSEWDTLGMRGTCSPGGTVSVRVEPWYILPEPFGEIAARTMVPTSHLLWSACWLGIATDAVAKARKVVRAKARAEPGAIPRAALRTVELVAKLQLMRNDIMSVAREYEYLVTNGADRHLDSLSFALRINNLKLDASRLVVEIASEALSICGIAAYKNDSPVSLGRHLRDAHSAALMINNERIQETNASLLLVHKDD